MGKILKCKIWQKCRNVKYGKMQIKIDENIAKIQKKMCAETGGLHTALHGTKI